MGIFLHLGFLFYAETINQLQGIVKKQELDIERLKNELEDTQEKARSSQSALDSSYK